MSEYVAPALALALPLAGGFAGGFVTKPAMKEWYPALRKPSWTPPKYAFGPVWSALYGSMGFASYLVWRDGGGFSGDNALPMALYGTQLAFNFAWSPLFFGAKKLGLATIDAVAMWGAIAGCIVTFYPVNKLAAGLMLPYIGWVSLATALTYTIWKDNKDRTD